MSKKANLTAIGAFIVGGLVLALVALVIFSKGKYFNDATEYVAYFSGSIKGLQVGAPVNFRGARVGVVTDIRILMRQSDDKMFIPVRFQLVKGQVSFTEEFGDQGSLTKEQRVQRVKELIYKRGMKAQLAMESFVTGKLFVELDFYPQDPIKLQSVVKDYMEFPTVPSSFEKISKTLEDIPVQEIAENLASFIKTVEKFITSGELKKSLEALTKFMDQSTIFIEKLNAQVPQELEETFRQARDTLAAYQALVEKGSPMEYQAEQSLSEIRAAAKSLRVLADYLARHPEALLKGKE